MKFTRIIAAIAFTTLMMVGCKNEATTNTDNATVTTEAAQQPAQLATASFTVEGMHCEVGCAGHLEKKLAKLDGVQKAEIDFEAETYVVATSETAILPWDGTATAPINQVNAVTANSTKPLFLALGVEFYQEINGQMYPLKNGAFNPLSANSSDIDHPIPI